MTRATGKGSKAACEAAGWKFAPIASISNMPSTINGRTTVRRYRHEGARGTMAIPPVGSGIEPRQFGGSVRAIAWAVEQLGEVAKQPSEALAGLAGVRLLLSAALASGEVCGGPDETPARPDGLLLTLCRDVICADREENAMRQGRLDGDKGRRAAFSSLIDVQAKAAPELTELHATTREGLLEKARAALVLSDALGLVGSQRLDIFRSLAVDLIHLVPTLIDERGRTVQRPAGDAEDVA